jgi:hypothetical protein
MDLNSVSEAHRQLSAPRQVTAQGADDLGHLVEPDGLHPGGLHNLRRLQRAAQIDLVCIEAELVRLRDALHLFAVRAFDTACGQVAVDACGSIIRCRLLTGDRRRPLSVISAAYSRIFVVDSTFSLWL